jgi:hypothetical protein
MSETKFDDSPGEIAYNAYCRAVGWKSVEGEQLPPFSQQSVHLKIAWEAAAEAVIEEVKE